MPLDTRRSSGGRAIPRFRYTHSESVVFDHVGDTFARLYGADIWPHGDFARQICGGLEHSFYLLKRLPVLSNDRYIHFRELSAVFGVICTVIAGERHPVVRGIFSFWRQQVDESEMFPQMFL